MQAEVGAAGRHALGGFAVDFGQRGRFPVVFLAMGVGTDDLARQGSVDEDDLAVGLAGNALGIHVHGQHFQPALGQRRASDGTSGRFREFLLSRDSLMVPRLSQAAPYREPTTAKSCGLHQQAKPTDFNRNHLKRLPGKRYQLCNQKRESSRRRRSRPLRATWDIRARSAIRLTSVAQLYSSSEKSRVALKEAWAPSVCSGKDRSTGERLER